MKAISGPVMNIVCPIYQLISQPFPVFHTFTSLLNCRLLFLTGKTAFKTTPLLKSLLASVSFHCPLCGTIGNLLL